MNKKEFDRIERRDVSKKDFTDAVKTIIEAKPGHSARSAADRQRTKREMAFRSGEKMNPLDCFADFAT